MLENSQKTLVVDLVVSLGAWCQVKYQIDNLCHSVVGSPFDWLVSPLNSLSMIMKDNGAKFSEKFVIDERKNAICAEYGIAYHHEFARDENGDPVLDVLQVRKVKEKLTYKMSKTKVLCKNKNVVFIRLGGHAAPAIAWPYIPDVTALRATDLNVLAKNIDDNFECQDFRIVVVVLRDFTNFIEDTILDPRIILEFMDVNHPVQGWEGSIELWRDLFLRLKDRGICDLLRVSK